VSAGYILDGTWCAMPEFIMREGYAWVGVTVQPEANAVGRLRTRSPTRYGQLDIRSERCSLTCTANLFLCALRVL
jgi:hypothetical protein